MNRDLVGKIIKIDRGGPESRVGKLLAVKTDYFTLLTEEEGIVFYQPHHIKSITQNVKKGMEFESDFLNKYQFNAPNDFKCILNSLSNYWVKVNRGGKESVEGVLSEVEVDYITIIANEEVIRISLFHIRNISYELNKDKKSKDESKNKDGKKDRQESDNSKRNRDRNQESSSSKEKKKHGSESRQTDRKRRRKQDNFFRGRRY